MKLFETKPTHKPTHPDSQIFRFCETETSLKRRAVMVFKKQSTVEKAQHQIRKYILSLGDREKDANGNRKLLVVSNRIKDKYQKRAIQHHLNMHYSALPKAGPISPTNKRALRALSDAREGFVSESVGAELFATKPLVLGQQIKGIFGRFGRRLNDKAALACHSSVNVFAYNRNRRIKPEKANRSKRYALSQPTRRSQRIADSKANNVVMQSKPPRAYRRVIKRQNRVLLGSIAFVNHACKLHANCTPYDNADGGERKSTYNYLLALRDIAPDEELTITYHDRRDGCKCRMCLK